MAVPLIQEYILTDNEFELFRELVYSECGIKLSNEKKELVKSRLAKRLRKHGLKTFKQYYKYVTEMDATGSELISLIDCISTNKTDFFREKAHFAYLNEKLLPTLVNEKGKKGNYRLRVWSAGCSTGEEPYTLAIILHNFLESRSRWDVKILATDISTAVLEKAIQGTYERERLEGVSRDIIKRHFVCTNGTDTTTFKVKEYLRNMTLFVRLNLMDAQFPFTGQFDFIFCRNVMIYFDKATQGNLVNKFYKHLAPGGHLFIGHSESLTGIHHGFDYVQPTVYRKPGSS